MGFSLPLLLEKGGFASDTCTMYLRTEGNRYTDIQLLPSETSLCLPETLYITNNYRNLPDVFPEQAGIIAVIPGEALSASDLSASASCPERQLIRKNYDILYMETTELLPDLFNRFCNIFRLLRDQVQALYQAICSQNSLQEILEQLCEYLGNSAYVVDSSFKVLAIDKKNQMRELSAVWKRLEDQGYLSYDLVTNLIESQELRGMESVDTAHLVHSQFFYVPFINYNLRRNGRLIGHLFVTGMRKPITPGDVELTSIFGRLVGQALSSNANYQNERGRYYEYFMNDILSGKLRDQQQIVQQMKLLHYHQDSYYCIVLILPSEKGELILERILSQIERFRGCKPVLYQQKIAAVLPLKKGDSLFEVMSQIGKLAEKLHFQAGISDIFQGFSLIPECCRQADYALQVQVKNPSGWILSYNECALIHLQRSFIKSPEEQYFYPSALHILKAYDQKYHTELLHTLKVFLEHERNVIETAESLFIHRNTLSYRIRKIQELCNLDLDHYILRTRLLLALQEEP